MERCARCDKELPPAKLRHRCTSELPAKRPGGPHGPCRTVTLTPAGWAASKYGRDPRRDPR